MSRRFIGIPSWHSAYARLRLSLLRLSGVASGLPTAWRCCSRRDFGLSRRGSAVVRVLRLALMRKRDQGCYWHFASVLNVRPFVAIGGQGDIGGPSSLPLSA